MTMSPNSLARAETRIRKGGVLALSMTAPYSGLKARIHLCNRVKSVERRLR